MSNSNKAATTSGPKVVHQNPQEWHSQHRVYCWSEQTGIYCPRKAKRKYATSKAVNSYTMNPSLYPFPRANKVFHFIHPLGIILYGMFAPLSCYLEYREVQSLSIAIQLNNKFSWKRLKDILCSISLKGGGLLLAFEENVIGHN